MRLSSWLRRGGPRLLLILCVAAPAAAVAVVFVARAPLPIAENLVEGDMTSAATLWTRRVVQILDAGAESLETGRLSAADATRLAQVPRASALYEVQLASADGRIFWSNHPVHVGASIGDEPLATVRSGAIRYTRRTVPPGEVSNLRLHTMDVDLGRPREIAEIQAPVDIDGRFVGAIEFHSDVTAQLRRYEERLRLLLMVLAAVTLAAFALVLAITTGRAGARIDELRRHAATERALVAEQARLSREVRLIGELNEWLQSSRSLDELFLMVARFMAHLLPAAEGSIYIYANSRDVLDGAAVWNGGCKCDHILPEDCWGLRRGRAYAFGDSEIDFACRHVEPHDGSPYYCFPILAHGEIVGLMHLKASGSTDAAGFGDCRKLARMCAEQIAMAVANVKMRDELQDQTIRDPLTGLYNRRHLTETLRHAVDRARRVGAAVSVVSVDIDHFKRFNDNHGHDAGDMVLRAVGTALRTAIAGDEIACRMGGEEFMLLLPDMSADVAATRANALRRAVEAVRVRYGNHALPAVTISAGVATFPDDGLMPQDLMRAADEALYAAKTAGRNAVALAGADLMPAENRAIVAEDVEIRPGAPQLAA